MQQCITRAGNRPPATVTFCAVDLHKRRQLPPAAAAGVMCMNELEELAKFAEILGVRASLKKQLDGTVHLFIMMHEMPSPNHMGSTMWKHCITVSEQGKNYLVHFNRELEESLDFQGTKLAITNWVKQPEKYALQNT